MGFKSVGKLTSEEEKEREEEEQRKARKKVKKTERRGRGGRRLRQTPIRSISSRKPGDKTELEQAMQALDTLVKNDMDADDLSTEDKLQIASAIGNQRAMQIFDGSDDEEDDGAESEEGYGGDEGQKRKRLSKHDPFLSIRQHSYRSYAKKERNVDLPVNEITTRWPALCPDRPVTGRKADLTSGTSSRHLKEMLS